MEITDLEHDVIPITILTGFLGAGKTTLLNRILQGDHGLKVGVLVNDFGSINIDAELIVGVEDEMISLANGCVCCELRDDLIESVEGLIARPETIEYIVLEASGVADPISLAVTFANPDLRDKIRLDGITCVVDADQVFAYPDYPDLMELKLRQIAASDMLILNKVDLAAEAEVRKVRAWIDDRINNVRIVETNYCEVTYEILLGVGRFDPTRIEFAETGGSDGVRMHDFGRPDHRSEFSTWSYESDRPLSIEALKNTVRKWPGSVYRCKGFVYAAESPHQKMILQTVGRRMDVREAEPWAGEVPKTRLVAIGDPAGMDEEALRTSLEACMLEVEA